MTTQLNLEVVWAASGGLTLRPGWETGWVAEIPTFQHFNYLLNALDRNSLSLAEAGDWQWQAGINFAVGASIREAGVQYFCVTAHLSSVTEQPSLDTLMNWWVKAPTFGTGTPTKSLGLAVREVNVRASGTAWTGHDVTLENSSALMQLATTGASDNWVFGNVAGEIVAINTGAAQVPTGANITPGQAGVSRVFHESHPPEVGEVTNAVEEAASDGVIRGRKDGGWIKVTATEVSETAPTPITGAGGGWYNLLNGQFYVDINDGDSSQWVHANPPIIPTPSAASTTYSGTLTSTNVKDALDELKALIDAL